MNYQEGDIIEINNKEYVIYAIIKQENNVYYYLISNFKPVEILFAKNTGIEEKDELTLINEQQEKIKVFDLFKSIYIK